MLRRQLLARKPNKLDLVFPSPRAALLNDDNVRHRVFRPTVRRTKLTGLRFHDLRHTYAALMVAAGTHPKYLQAQMGHSSMRVTLDLPTTTRALNLGSRPLAKSRNEFATPTGSFA